VCPHVVTVRRVDIAEVESAASIVKRFCTGQSVCVCPHVVTQLDVLTLLRSSQQPASSNDSVQVSQCVCPHVVTQLYTAVCPRIVTEFSTGNIICVCDRLRLWHILFLFVNTAIANSSDNNDSSNYSSMFSN